jgi:cell division protein FtsA
VLVGGTAKLPGIDEVARDRLQIAAGVGKLRQLSGLVDTVDDQAYYSAVGLMMLDMLLAPEEGVRLKKDFGGRTLSFMDKLLRTFKR